MVVTDKSGSHPQGPRGPWDRSVVEDRGDATNDCIRISWKIKKTKRRFSRVDRCTIDEEQLNWEQCFMKWARLSKKFVVTLDQVVCSNCIGSELLRYGGRQLVCHTADSSHLQFFVFSTCPSITRQDEPFATDMFCHPRPPFRILRNFVLVSSLTFVGNDEKMREHLHGWGGDCFAARESGR